VGRYYPEWARARLRSAGYVLDDATGPDNTSPEPDTTIVASPLVAVSSNYPEHIVKAFRDVADQGRPTAKLSMPG
jgi:hypothetical protein